MKLCDLGVSLPLSDDLRAVKDPSRHVYEGTEPWRAPETIGSDDPSRGVGGAARAQGPPVEPGSSVETVKRQVA